jgi:negative regulator of sigma E activity
MSAANTSGPAGQEERESLLSAMYDGEAAAGECDLVARRLARDPKLRRRWARYALVGAVVRGDQRFLASEGFSSRLAELLADEPAHGESSTAPAPAGAARRSSLRDFGRRWGLPVASVGVAAGVAAMSILFLRAEPRVAEVVTAAARDAAPSYTEPQTLGTPGGRPGAAVVPAAQLANYVVAHSEYSNPLGRRNLLSALMAGESFGNGSAGWPATGPDRDSEPTASVRAIRTSDFADGSALDEPGGGDDAAR